MKKSICMVLILLVGILLCACSEECSCECVYCCGGENLREESSVAHAEPEIVPYTIEQTEPVEENIREPELAVEDFEITKLEGDELWFRVKIRNISARDLVKFSFQYQVIDKNGDILRYQLCGANTVAAGQAIWAGQFAIRDLTLEDVDAMGFVSDWSTNSPALKERVVFKIEDYR